MGIYRYFSKSSNTPRNIHHKDKGKPYFAAADFAKAIGKHVYTNDRGLVLINETPIKYTTNPIIDDCVVTLFDTPEKYADPDIAIRYIPYLHKQGKWTDHARVTKEQLKDLEEGEETEWPLTPESEYNLNGFNSTLLGSKVPSPGVYPRILFSPQDIPMLKRHIANNKSAQKGLIEIEILLKRLGLMRRPVMAKYSNYYTTENWMKYVVNKNFRKRVQPYIMSPN
ncbi:hypothetical protein SFC43_25650 [Bacteroides sp. CR5/BHMF/2]|nr:hypothetical protein [Bacteroides sp. CR5/BHMF/2]